MTKRVLFTLLLAFAFLVNGMAASSSSSASTSEENKKQAKKTAKKVKSKIKDVSKAEKKAELTSKMTPKQLKKAEKLQKRLDKRIAKAEKRAAKKPNGKTKKWVPAFLLCWFLGTLGIHRFYLGYTWQGIVQLLTLGGLGIWVLIDWIRLLINDLKAKDGSELENYPF